jgi:transposase
VKREAFCKKIKGYEEAGRPIVYIDESGFAHDMPRRYGYAPIGQRCFGLHNWHEKGRINAVGALVGTTLLTICLFSTTMNADRFHAWLIHDLIPKLPPQSVLVMDNATFHKRNDIPLTVAKAGHNLEYLPTYSPDLNPIEHKWAQAKHIRKTTKCSVEEIFTKNNI